VKSKKSAGKPRKTAKPARASAARPSARKAASKAAKAPSRPAARPAAKSAAKSAARPAARPAAKKAKAGSKPSPSARSSSKAGKSGKKKVLCEFCGAVIPAMRIEALPDTTTCVDCSQTKPYSEAQIIGLNGEEADQNRLNVEDFEEADTDFSVSYNDQW
jgi:hypothetical protein